MITMMKSGRCGVMVLALALGLVLAGGLAAGPAAANSYCNTYCSGPHKAYDSCMRECIGRQEYRDPRDAHRAARDLCSSPGHDERECRNELRNTNRRNDYYRPVAPPQPQFEYLPQARPMRCWEDYRGQMICRPD
jgi:hypothetical protein